jgi:hypothetical protein
MLIATGRPKDGSTGVVLVLGLDDENVRRLKQGEPIVIRHETHGEVVPEGIVLVIRHAHTLDDLADELAHEGLITPRTIEKDYR